MYLLPWYKRVLIRARENTGNLEIITAYKTNVTVLSILLILSFHMLFWTFLICNIDFPLVIILGGTYGLYKVLIERLYMAKDYFIISDKKIYYKKLDSVHENNQTKLDLIIDTKKYQLNCQSVKFKEEIIKNIKLKCINIT
ncbi:MAG: hypothetical protein CVV02_17970 [Firmicutes bacterium HGW-Firmicutes-7]|nr:MAG: hypothetical protein CVV02_17970 [Firmicutes bacterium HGW-Firmicutes-7]